MPRIVNLSSSDVSSDEDINSSKKKRLLPKQPNQRPAYRSSIPKRCNTEYTTNSQKNMPMISYSEEEVYCLAQVINGRVRKFKKDTRTWLHKSSDKKNMKQDVGNVEQASLLNRSRLPPNYSLNSSKHSIDKEINSQFEKCKTARPTPEGDADKNIMEMVAFFNDDRGEGNRNCKETKSVLEPLSEDEFTFIGDSDADLTYSEEDTPVKIHSFVEEWRQADHSVSSDSVEAVDKPMMAHSLTSIGSLRGDSSFEELELGNESGNSIKTATTELNIARTIAPAIEIEDESYRENILDYAVNQGSRSLSNDEKACCEEIFRKTRSRGAVRTTGEPSGCRTSKRRPAGKHVTPLPSRATSRYNLRSTPSHRQVRDEIGVVKKTSGSKVEATWESKVEKQPSKRLRFNCHADTDVEPNCKHAEAEEHPFPVRRPEPEPEVRGVNQPSCSNAGHDVDRGKVPSLFVIAGYVLYGVFKGNVERC